MIINGKQVDSDRLALFLSRYVEALLDSVGPRDSKYVNDVIYDLAHAPDQKTLERMMELLFGICQPLTKAWTNTTNPTYHIWKNCMIEQYEKWLTSILIPDCEIHSVLEI